MEKTCPGQNLTSPTTNKKVVGNQRNGPGKKLEDARTKGKWGSRKRVTENMICKEGYGAESYIYDY